MGRGLARLLARKGANIVIVARNQQKLDAALEYITVRMFGVLQVLGIDVVLGYGERCKESKISCHQCRSDQG